MELLGLTYDYSRNGVHLRRTVGMEILSNTGVWADVAFLHQDRDLATDGWKPAKITIARFKKIDGIWKKQSHFNVNNAERAGRIVVVLTAWQDKVGFDVRETEED